MMYPNDPVPRHRYVILDASGVMLNRIATDVASLTYGGYGQYVAYEGDGDVPQIETQDPLIFLGVKPDAPMCQGDTMDIHTGGVTPAPQSEPTPEEFQEGLA